MTMPHPHAPSAVGGIGDKLGGKLGPLPVWMWGIGAGVGAIVFLKVHPLSSGSTTGSTTLDTTGTGTTTGGVPGPAGPAGAPGTNGTNGKQGTAGKTGKTGATGKTGKTGPPGHKGCNAGYTWDPAKKACVKNKKTKPPLKHHGMAASVMVPNNSAPTLSNDQAGSVQIGSVDTTPINMPRVATGGGSHSAPVSLHPPVVTNPTGTPYGGGSPTLVPRGPVVNPYRVPGRPSHHLAG